MLWGALKMGASVCAAISLSLGIGFPGGPQPPERSRSVLSTLSGMTKPIASSVPERCSYHQPSAPPVGSRQPGVTDADGRSLRRVYDRTSTATPDVGAMFWVAPKGGRSVEPCWLGPVQTSSRWGCSVLTMER